MTYFHGIRYDEGDRPHNPAKVPLSTVFPMRQNPPDYPTKQEKLTERDGAADFLGRAASLMAERGQQYDQPAGERSMGRAVAAFNAITGWKLTEADGWLLLQILKDARQWQREDFHRDSAEDCVAYAALKAEALARGA